MADHTKEPWVYLRIEPQTASADFSEPYSPWVTGAGPRAVAVGKSICIHADDMRRIVACVNACAGFKTEAIEAGVINPAAQEQELDTLRARVSELEAFCHAARAEALREAADELKKIEIHQQSYAYKMLRAMSDREGI